MYVIELGIKPNYSNSIVQYVPSGFLIHTQVSAVPVSSQVESLLARTAFSLTECYPGQRSAWPRVICDSAQLDWVLSWTAPSLTQCYSGKRPAFDLEFSLDSASLTQCYPEKCSAWLRNSVFLAMMLVKFWSNFIYILIPFYYKANVFQKFMNEEVRRHGRNQTV